jgi:hypothetical protein
MMTQEQQAAITNQLYARAHTCDVCEHVTLLPLIESDGIMFCRPCARRVHADVTAFAARLEAARG